jgi:hypothetical protein
MAVRLCRRNTSRREHNGRCEYSADTASHIVLHSKSCRLFEAVGRTTTHARKGGLSTSVEILKGLFDRPNKPSGTGRKGRRSVCNERVLDKRHLAIFTSNRGITHTDGQLVAALRAGIQGLRRLGGNSLSPQCFAGRGLRLGSNFCRLCDQTPVGDQRRHIVFVRICRWGNSSRPCAQASIPTALN